MTDPIGPPCDYCGKPTEPGYRDDGTQVTWLCDESLDDEGETCGFWRMVEDDGVVRPVYGPSNKPWKYAYRGGGIHPDNWPVSWAQLVGDEPLLHCRLWTTSSRRERDDD